MKNSDSCTKDNEILDTEVSNFLVDIDITLGHDYQQWERQLFPQFSPQFHKITADELPLVEKLTNAYKALEGSKKLHARLIVLKALERCSTNPLGLKRSLVCIDLAHEIDPALTSEAIYSDLMFRTTNTDELSEWLWQLIRRWRKWNIKVTSSYDEWEKAIKAIAPKGILDLLLYLQEQKICASPAWIKKWHQLICIALIRIENEENSLLDAGYDPDIVKDRISTLCSSLLIEGSVDHVNAPAQSPIKQRDKLLSTVRPTLRNKSMEIIKEECEWLADYGEAIA